MKRPNLFMVFDVESVGLHGEGFAVGFVVVDRDGFECDSGIFACPPEAASGDDAGRTWIAENVRIEPRDILCGDPREVRDKFWARWQEHKEKGATLSADCAWPVEARFLAACVDDDPGSRCWGGPYPLHEIASVRFAIGLDPLATVDRLPDELPAHDPLADARQSARLLVQAMDNLDRHHFWSE